MNNQHPNSTDENSPSKLGRREFLTASAGAVAAALLAAGSNSLFAESSDDGMIYRTLGRTGERVSRIDLMQFHEVIRLEDPDRIFAEGGAFEAMVEAQKAGKVRYIGFTGHKDPLVHLRMLDLARKHKFHFDGVQMPLNVMDAHFRSFEREVLPVLNREGIAPLAKMAFGHPFILHSNTVKPIEALQYCLNLPIAVQITGIDSQHILDQALEAVRTFKPLTQAQVVSLLKRTRTAALEGKYELYKTSTRFDGTQRHPEWLGEDPLAR